MNMFITKSDVTNMFITKSDVTSMVIPKSDVTKAQKSNVSNVFYSLTSRTCVLQGVTSETFLLQLKIYRHDQNYA